MLLAVAALALPFRATAVPQPAVPSHELTLRFDLGGHRLVAEDVFRVESDEEDAPLTLALDPDLRVLALAVGDEAVEIPARTLGGEFTIRVPRGTSQLRVRYAGEIFDVVREADTLTWVVGDETRGVISEQGIFLSRASRWIPEPPEPGVARYDLTTYVPAPFHVVTQGGIPERSTVRGLRSFHATTDVVPREPDGDEAGPLDTWHVARWRPVLPTEGVALSGGAFLIESREVEGVRISTYFFEAEAAEAPLWLDAAEEVVRRYRPILGPYPHPRFDIVENFFQTGYGMPAWTLLGNRVIQYVTARTRRSGEPIPPGYLDHEYVHGWFGNGLFVDTSTGNWSEALTSYLSNYLAVELEDAEKAREYRRSVMEKFSIRVRGARDYPLREFRQKTEDADNDVGYGKGSLVFHVIRRLVGSDLFFATLRSVVAERLGTLVSWDDWLAAFSSASGRDVATLVHPWLEREGLPSLRLGLVSEEALPEGTGWRYRLRVDQVLDAGKAPWPVRTEVGFEGTGELPRTTVDVSRGRAELALDVRGERPEAVVLDPDFHLPRRIPEADLPPCLNRTLEAPGDGVVQLSHAAPELEALAERLARAKGFRVVKADYDLDSHAGPAVVLEVAGEPERGLEVGGQTFTGPDVSALRSYASGGHPRTRYTALSASAAARAGYLPFYGWDTWVVFQAGRPAARATVRPERTAARILLSAAAP